MDYKLEFKEHIKVSDSLSLSSTKKYYKKHPFLFIVSIIIIVGTSLIGFIIDGAVGVVIGFIISILVFLFLPPASEKIIETYNH